jgi:hypothetical protein
MRFKFRGRLPEGCQENFEFLEESGLYWGSGAPAFVPSENQSAQKLACFYFRRDTPGVANQRIYVWNGSAWTGIV